MPARSVSISNENELWILNRRASFSQVINDSLNKARSEENLLSNRTLLSLRKYSAEMSVTGGIVNQRDIIEEAVTQYLNKISFVGNMSSNTGLEKAKEKQDSNS